MENAPPTPGELRALAHQLMAWANQMASRPAAAYAMPAGEDSRELVLSFAMATREVRRRRAEIFPQLQLREPMWDVLLELFIQQERGHRVTLDHLILTGELEVAVLRHAVTVLVTTGLVDRTIDLFDKRIMWLTLSEAGYDAMIEHFTGAVDFLRPISEPLPELAARAFR